MSFRDWLNQNATLPPLQSVGDYYNYTTTSHYTSAYPAEYQALSQYRPPPAPSPGPAPIPQPAPDVSSYPQDYSNVTDYPGDLTDYPGDYIELQNFVPPVPIPKPATPMSVTDFITNLPPPLPPLPPAPDVSVYAGGNDQLESALQPFVSPPVFVPPAPRPSPISVPAPLSFPMPPPQPPIYQATAPVPPPAPVNTLPPYFSPSPMPETRPGPVPVTSIPDLPSPVISPSMTAVPRIGTVIDPRNYGVPTPPLALPEPIQVTSTKLPEGIFFSPAELAPPSPPQLLPQHGLNERFAVGPPSLVNNLAGGAPQAPANGAGQGGFPWWLLLVAAGLYYLNKK